MRSQGRTTSIAVFSVAVALLALLGSGCPSRQSSQSAGGGAPPTDASASGAPDFTLTDLQGNQVSLSDFTGQKAVMIDFWASWCGPCKRAMPHTQKVHDDYGDQVQVLAISLDGSKEEASNFIQSEGYTFTVLWDAKVQDVAEQYSVTGIPHMVFIDKDGNIADTLTGAGGEGAVLDKLKSIGVGG
jgi:thiol-disulfide isomerase/thioredoxin